MNIYVRFLPLFLTIFFSFSLFLPVPLSPPRHRVSLGECSAGKRIGTLNKLAEGIKLGDHSTRADFLRSLHNEFRKRNSLSYSRALSILRSSRVLWFRARCGWDRYRIVTCILSVIILLCQFLPLPWKYKEAENIGLYVYVCICIVREFSHNLIVPCFRACPLRSSFTSSCIRPLLKSQQCDVVPRIRN